MIFPKRKKMRRAWIGAILAMIALAAALMLWLPSRTVSMAAAAPDDMAGYFRKAGVIKIPRIPPPVDFALADLNGRQVRLSDFKDRVVLLSFWTTWCPDCRVEMPALENLHQRFKDRAFVMLAVDLRESSKTVQHFFDDQRLSFTALLDNDGQVARSFGIRSIPTTFIIDQGGGMIGKAIGSRKWDGSAVVALFEQLIDNPPDHPVK